jgi:transposase-like protein
LSHRQQAALAALSNGRTIRDAAKSIGVNRNTVARWLRTDPRFRAAYNAWRQELIDSTRSRLLRTAELAAAAVHKQIAKGDGRLALALLDRLGLASDAAAVAGPPDAEGARDEIAVERAEHSHALHVRVERARLAPFGYFDEQHLAPFRQQVDEHARQTDEPTQPGDPKLSAMPGPNP